MSYVVQTGDTIAAVTRQLDCSFRQLKQANPKALGRTKDGRWFLKEGATVDSPGRTRVAAVKTAPVPTTNTGGTYEVAPGETVRQVCRKLGQPFSLLRSLNPEAVAQTEDGRWFFKAGAKITSSATFDQTLANAVEKTNDIQAVADRPPATSATTAAAAPQPVQGTAAPPAKILTSRAPTSTSSSRAAPDEAAPPPQTRSVSPPVATKPLPSSEVTPPDPEPTLLSRVEALVESLAPDVEVVDSFAAGDISRPYRASTEESLRYKAALSPSLDLTLGLARENHRQEDILAGASDGPVDRAVTMGLRFKF